MTDLEYTFQSINHASALLWVLRQPVSMTDPDVVDRLIKAIQDESDRYPGEPQPILIIVDTLSRASGGDVDERTEQGMQKILRGVNAVCRAFHASALVLQHPTNDEKQIRGSGVLSADADAVLHLDIADGTSPKAPLVPLVLTNEKAREGGSFEKIRLLKRAVQLVDSPEEAVRLLQRENQLRGKSAAPLLDNLPSLESCVIELSGVPALSPEAKRPTVAKSKSAKKHGKNVTLLVEALRQRPERRFETDAEWKKATVVPHGSFDAAKKQVFDLKLAEPNPNGKGGRLIEFQVITE
jgi:hypothetical protein